LNGLMHGTGSALSLIYRLRRVVCHSRLPLKGYQKTLLQCSITGMTLSVKGVN
jgi:hypothetical protein